MPNAEATRVEGDQVPRIHVVPEYKTTTGDAAVELAALAGLHLYPWQQLVLRESLGEREDGRWAALEVGLVVPRQNGKGSILAARELAGLFLDDINEELAIHTAFLFGTAQEGFLRIKKLISECPMLHAEVARYNNSHGQEGIEMKNGKRLKFMARSKDSGRGFTADALYLDEAYNLSVDALNALQPTMANRPNPQIWFTSSAGGQGMTNSEVLRARRDLAESGGSKRLAYFEWSTKHGPDEFEQAIGDHREYLRANPTIGHGNIDLDFLDSCAASAPDGGLGFAREYLGVWFDETYNQALPPQKWADCADPAPITGGKVFAVDVSWDRAFSAISAGGVRADGQAHVEIVDRQAGTDWVVAKLLELQKAHKPKAILIDPGGPAGSLIARLADAGVKIKDVTTREFGQACGLLYDSVVSGEVCHSDQDWLNDSINGALRRKLGDAYAWDRKESDGEIASLVSATLALYAYEMYGKTNVNTEAFLGFL